jgi:hypothetical protein
MSVSASSNKLREFVEQFRIIEANYKQVTDTTKVNWTDRRQQEFYMKFIHKQSDTLAELHRDLNAIWAEVSRMESSLNRYK